jgi:hypothetical protein
MRRTLTRLIGDDPGTRSAIARTRVDRFPVTGIAFSQLFGWRLADTSRIQSPARRAADDA